MKLLLKAVTKCVTGFLRLGAVLLLPTGTLDLFGSVFLYYGAEECRFHMTLGEK